MSEKIVVFGLGRDFVKNKERILEKYEVAAYTDNHLLPDDKELFVTPDKINSLDFDKVLICTQKHKDAIKYQLVVCCGIDEKHIVDLSVLGEKTGRGYFSDVLKDMSAYKAKNKDGKFAIDEGSLQIITEDKSDSAGIVETHYFAQDIWGGQKILNASPNEHYDIGSRLNGFLSHLLVFREVNYIDIRPLPCHVPGLHFIQADATNLENIPDASIESLSSLHAIEHFGLGRYGDEIDPDAYIKVIKSIQRVMQPKGRAYIGVPVGPKDRLVFNAHRIFAINTVLGLFDGMELKDMRVVKGDNAYAEKISEEDYGSVPDYSCGLFEFEKP